MTWPYFVRTCKFVYLVRRSSDFATSSSDHQNKPGGRPLLSEYLNSGLVSLAVFLALCISCIARFLQLSHPPALPPFVFH